jgi:hypothetical protein
MTARQERLRRLRGKGMDVAKLARAEETLRTMGDAKLSPEWIDATVARVTSTAVASRRPRLVRRMAFAAAALLLGVLSMAGVKVLWPEGRDAINTLDYPTALGILEQPKDTEQRQCLALAIASGRINRVIADFEQLSKDPSTSLEVSTGVAHRLASLRQALDGPMPKRVGATIEMKELVDTVMQPDMSDAERLRLVDQLYNSTLNGILTVREMTAESGMARKGRDHLLRTLRSKSASPANTPSSVAPPSNDALPSSEAPSSNSTPSSKKGPSSDNDCP